MKTKGNCISASFIIFLLFGVALSVNSQSDDFTMVTGKEKIFIHVDMLKEARERKTSYEIQDESGQRVRVCCPIVELRQYTLHPGKRDILIDLFDREFIESQEAVGMTIIGQFSDLDNPDRFVWLRGFQDMPSRARALADFYGGPVWKANSKAANATMIDSGNVLLLRTVAADTGFLLRNDRSP